MSHVTLRNSYKTLSDRLNLFPQGAPPTELLFRILEVLFTKDEAALVALLPIRPFNVAAAASVWKKPAAESRKILEGLASKGMLLDMEMQGEQIFVLPPPMAGFFEFSMMRMGNGYDQKLLAELFYQYLNVEEDFVRNLFAGGETQIGRVFVNERALNGENTLTVMDYERASEVIHTASHMGIGSCYCRHKMQHLGKACGAPMDICMTFSGAAQSLIKLRCPESHCHRQLHARGERRGVQRLRQMRSGLPGGGDGAGLSRRSAPAQAQKGARR